LLDSFTEGFDNSSLSIGVGLCKMPHQRGYRHDGRPKRCRKRRQGRPSLSCVSAYEQRENNQER
jgi:hypothetical protein